MKKFAWFLLLDLAARGRFVDSLNLSMALNRLADSGLPSCPLQLWIMDLSNPSQTILSSLEFKVVLSSLFWYMLMIY